MDEDFEVPVYPGGIILTEEEQRQRGIKVAYNKIVVEMACSHISRFIEIYSFYESQYSQEGWTLREQQPANEGSTMAGLKASNASDLFTIVLVKTPRAATASISRRPLPFMERLVNKLWPEKPKNNA